jgi:hypothetical protein
MSDLEREDLENRIRVLEAQLAHQKALWEEVWKGLRATEISIAKSHGFGEFRNVELPHLRQKAQ